MIFSYEHIFFLRCEVWDKDVEQKGALPPSKSSIWSKKSAPKKYVYFKKHMTNIFHFGLPQCILLLVRSQIASDLCKAE